MRGINLIPFHYDQLSNTRFHQMEILYNVLVFVPAGFFFSAFGKGKITSGIIASAMLSLCFEIPQWIFALGASDITDLMAHLLSWMRQYNEKADEGEDLRFYGFDMQRNEANYEYFIETAKASGADTAELEKIWNQGVLSDEYTIEQKAEIIEAVKAELLEKEAAQAIHFADILLQNMEKMSFL